MTEPTPPTRQTYRLADPSGGYWYLIPDDNHGWSQATWTGIDADGNEVPTVPNAEQYAKWLWCPVVLSAIVRRLPGKTTILDYELNGTVGPTEANPQVISTEEYQRRNKAEDFEGITTRIYQARKSERGPDEAERFEVSSVELVGAPPWVGGNEIQGLTWKADLPSALRERTEYMHLFPGHLNGVRNAAKKYLDSLDGVQVLDYDSKWKVTLRLWNPTPPKPKTGRGSRTTPKRTYRTIEIPIPRPPASIAGTSRDEALAEYQAYLDRAEAIIANRHRCPTCNGTGYTQTKETHQ